MPLIHWGMFPALTPAYRAELKDRRAIKRNEQRLKSKSR